jgi:uncharacterized protein YjbJ (UPF0337 family)
MTAVAIDMMGVAGVAHRHLICGSFADVSAKMFRGCGPQCGMGVTAMPRHGVVRATGPVVIGRRSFEFGFFVAWSKTMATQERLLGNWNQLKGKIKQQWGQLTDDELNEVEGNFDQLVGLVQQKTGEARKYIERTLSDLNDQAGGVFTHATEAARQYVDQASDRLRGAADQIRERTREGYDEARELLRRRPAESVAIAFGTGLVVGLLVGIVAGTRK